MMKPSLVSCCVVVATCALGACSSGPGAREAATSEALTECPQSPPPDGSACSTVNITCRWGDCVGAGTSEWSATCVLRSDKTLSWEVRPTLICDPFCTISRYSVEALGTLGGTFSYPVGINRAGEIVGHSSTVTGRDDGFLTPTSVGQPLVDLTAPQEGISSDINDAGQIVGTVFRDLGTGLTFAPQPFLTTRTGTLQLLPTLPGGSNAYANAISDNGVVVGVSQFAGAQPFGGHAYEIAGGVPIDLHPRLLDPRMATYTSEAWDVNRTGVVVGYAAPATGPYGSAEINQASAIVWGALLTMRIPTLQCYGANVATAINANNLVVGWSKAIVDGIWGLRRAFSYQFQEPAIPPDLCVIGTPAPGVRDLGALQPGGESMARGVADDGTVVGEASVIGTTRGWHGFAWTRACGMVDLNSRLVDSGAWEITSAKAVNANGVIAATALYKGTEQAVRLVPVP